MTILKGIGYYFLCVFILFASIIFSGVITKSIFIVISVFFIVNLICGVFLLKKVQNNLITYHPMYDTIDNIASDKFNSIIFWFFRYPFLFIKLAIVKI
jgi:hypothetical protein